MTTTKTCRRCKGTGTTSHKHVEMGRCFRCNGTGIDPGTKAKVVRSKWEVTFVRNGRTMTDVVNQYGDEATFREWLKSAESFYAAVDVVSVAHVGEW
jgi:Zn-finger nucleic acid-binding protein